MTMLSHSQLLRCCHRKVSDCIGVVGEQDGRLAHTKERRLHNLSSPNNNKINRNTLSKKQQLTNDN